MYLLEEKGERFVVRAEPNKETLPGVDPLRERNILDAIAHFQWSPKLMINEPQQGLLIMRHAGECSGVLSSAQKTVLLKALTEMQSLTELPMLDYAALFQQYRDELRDSGHQQLVDETEQQLISLPEMPRVLVHHDLHPGNICWQNGDATIIDWEYAGVGVAWLDYAVLIRDLGFTASELMQLPLLNAFNEQELTHWLAQSIQVVDQLEMLWSHYKSQVTG
ncbi:phosphotransferase family protein [Marinobacterium sp. xm-d-579]|uniref:phosphotransferase family protein n=1 Tax=Marinobacterium sp. xm-d-579 TaxID=2497734 RepID=UPI001568FEC4|nr:phosphotransferase [Marinobacterium sp. xm-d-579]